MRNRSLSPIHWITIAVLAIAAAFGLRLAVDPGTASGDSSALVLDQSSADADTDRLVALFEQRVAARGEYADLATLGRLYLNQAAASGQVPAYQRAHRTLTEASGRAPSDTDVTLALAQASLALHDFDGAIAAAQQLTALTPDDPNVHALIGDAALAIGDIDLAAESYARIDDPAISDPSVTLRLAQLAWSRGDVDGANTLSREAMNVAAELGLPTLGRDVFTTAHADFLFHQGRYDEVVALVETIETNPAATHVHAEALAALGRFDAAIDELEPKAQGDVELLMLLEELYLATGAFEGAESVMSEIEALVAGDTTGAFDRTVAGWLADRNREIDRALDLVNRDDREDAGAHDTRAWVLYRAGDHQEARRFADLALASQLPDPLISLHSALIWEALGDMESAKSDAQRALDLSPEFSPTFAQHARDLVGRDDS